jgi:N-acyl-D-amino-acid deacylase
MKTISLILCIFLSASIVSAQAKGNDFDIVIKGGMVYDGSGGKPIRADVGINGDKVVKIGDLSRAKATMIIDASGMAVAPGFINMLSWSTESLIVDPRSLGELYGSCSLGAR